MAIIEFDTKDAVWVGRDLYCKTPEASELVRTKLTEIGYEVKDQRVDSYSIRQGETTPEEMEQHGWAIWYASLDIRRGKCKSCNAYISTRGIRSHGHACEKCGAVTYYKLVEGSTIRFSFQGEERHMFSPELNMEVIHWDHDAAWLYLDPEPLERGGLSVVSGERGRAYLRKYADNWSLMAYNGRPAIKVHYSNSPYIQETDVISVMDTFGHKWNHTIVNVWEGVEYSEYDRNLPVPESVSIYELWHHGLWESSPTLHEKVISAAGQTSRASYYYQDGRPAWSRAHYEIMGQFIRHCTTLDADLWDRVSPRFPLDGPGGIAAVARFCHSAAIIDNEPNVGNFLAMLTGMDTSRANHALSMRALAADPDTKELFAEYWDAIRGVNR